MKLQDRITIGISFLALVVSIASAVHDWAVEHQADVKKDQSDVYNAYQLGQSTAVIWAYEKSTQTSPPVNGQTQAQIGHVQLSLWTFKAQGYAEYFKLTAERFQDFLKQVKSSDAQGTSGTFEELDSAIQVKSGRKAVAAYDLGWQTTVFGIESAANLGVMKETEFRPHNGTSLAAFAVGFDEMAGTLHLFPGHYFSNAVLPLYFRG